MTLGPNETNFLISYGSDLAAAATGTAVALGFKHRAAIRAHLGAAWHDMVHRGLPQATEEMERRGTAWLDRLGGEIAATAPEGTDPDEVVARVLERLADPDIAVTMHDALLAAGRMGSDEQHAVLAKTIAARFAAPSDTDRAVVARRACELVGLLGPSQLGALGILALVRHIAAVPELGIPPELQARYDDAGRRVAAGLQQSPQTIDPTAHLDRTAIKAITNTMAQELAPARAAQLAAWTARHRCAARITPLDALHLASTGAVVITGDADGLHIDLVGSAYNSNDEAPSALLRRYVAAAVANAEGVAPLRDAWQHGVNRLMPTAAGLLVGLAVHDALTGDHRVREWEWGPPVSGGGSLQEWPSTGLRWP